MNAAEPNVKVDIDARYRTLLVLWLALLMNVGVLFVVTTLAGSSPSAEVGANQLLNFVFGGVGAFAAIISFAVRSKLLQRSVEKQDVGLVQSALIVGCALCEVPALLGLIQRFTVPGNDYFVLFLISALAMALHFPRRANLVAASYKDPTYGAAL